MAGQGHKPAAWSAVIAESSCAPITTQQTSQKEDAFCKISMGQSTESPNMAPTLLSPHPSQHRAQVTARSRHEGFPGTLMSFPTADAADLFDETATCWLDLGRIIAV
jgi:hypothetical protein